MNTKNWKESFKQLPFEKKEAMFNLLSEKMEKATDDGDGDKINRIEKSMVRALTKNWNSVSTKAINKALKTFPKNEKRFTKKDSDKVLRSLDSSYKNVENKTKSRVEEDLEAIYRVNKVRFGKQFKLNPTDKAVIFQGYHFDPLKKAVVRHNKFVQSIIWQDDLEEKLKAIEIGINDRLAFENLARLQNTAIGDHYPKTLKPRVSKTLQKALDRGLNHADTSATLESELTQILGGEASSIPASVGTGKASTAAYFEMLSATNVTYARNFGQIELMSEVGITELVFQAIIDNLTSVVCTQMDGRVFTIEQAIEHRNKVLEMPDVESLKEFAPFRRNLDDFKLTAGTDLTRPEVQDKLAKAGVIVPPLHGRCRSELNPL